MHELREDLDGLRLTEPGKPDVWLVFHGRRHRVSSPLVYDALFADTQGLVHTDEIASIMMGPELNDGTCLVRAFDTLAIFLVTGRYPRVTRHYIPSFESFSDFGFALDAVKEVPLLMLENITLAAELISIADRRRNGVER